MLASAGGGTTGSPAARWVAAWMSAESRDT
jgi:hypothetical protein